MNAKTFEEVLGENGAIYWKVKGSSMLPIIREGKDIFIIEKRPAGQLKKYQVVLFKRPDAAGKISYVLHRILKVNAGGTYWIVGDNCVSGEMVRDENILGVLTAVVRNGEKRDGNSLMYKMYVRLWCAPWRIRFCILKNKWRIERIMKSVKGMIHFLSI